MSLMNRSKNQPPPGILDKSLSRGKSEVNLSSFALMFAEIVRYSQNRVNTVPQLHENRLLDVLVLREKGYKRETKLLNVLMFVKSNVWRSLFGREADKLERSNDDPSTYYLIENESLVNTFISTQKDKATLNCAAFVGGIVEAVLNGCNFPCKVTALWYNGTTYVIKFEDSVIRRETA